jgi:hypothetical protein
MGKTISSAGRTYAKLSNDYDRASYELEMAEQAVKCEIESEVRELLQSIAQKHGVRVSAIFPRYVMVTGEGASMLASVDIDIEAADS